MNGIAKDLHLKRTKFTDPTGLRGNVSTAREMAIALRAALEDDVLRDDHERPRSRRSSRRAAGRRSATARRTSRSSCKQVRRDRRQDRLHRRRRLLLHHRARSSASREVVMAFLGADGKQTPVRRLQPRRRVDRRGAPGGEDRGALGEGAAAAESRPRDSRPRRETVAAADDLLVEERRERGPCEVRRHQLRRAWVDLARLMDVRADRGEQRAELDEREPWLARTEEDRRPAGVQGELRAPQGQARCARATAALRVRERRKPSSARRAQSTPVRTPRAAAETAASPARRCTRRCSRCAGWRTSRARPLPPSAHRNRGVCGSAWPVVVQRAGLYDEA